MLGIVSFVLLFVWAMTAIYFAFPEPFEGTIDYFDDDLNDLRPPRRMGSARAHQAALRPVRRARGPVPLGCARSVARRAVRDGLRALVDARRAASRGRTCGELSKRARALRRRAGGKNVIMLPQSMTATRNTSDAAATIFVLRGASSCGPSVRTPANSRQ